MEDSSHDQPALQGRQKATHPIVITTCHEIPSKPSTSTISHPPCKSPTLPTWWLCEALTMVVQTMQNPVRRNRMVLKSLIGVKVKVLKVWNPKKNGKKTLWWRLFPPGTCIHNHGAFNHLCMCIMCGFVYFNHLCICV